MSNSSMVVTNLNRRGTNCLSYKRSWYGLLGLNHPVSLYIDPAGSLDPVMRSKQPRLSRIPMRAS